MLLDFMINVTLNSEGTCSQQTFSASSASLSFLSFLSFSSSLLLLIWSTISLSFSCTAVTNVNIMTIPRFSSACKRKRLLERATGQQKKHKPSSVCPLYQLLMCFCWVWCQVCRPVASKALECLQRLNLPGSPVKRSPREGAHLDISPNM